ncbi:MAG TPA: hypothetical protein EYQ47_00865 [Cycloclasticus sp.]|jgi:hypothetical protein|nr:hypothetical protein [Cycloclasticus sp.]
MTNPTLIPAIASAINKGERPLAAFNDPVLFDNQHQQWLELWDGQASYRMPVRVTHTKRQRDLEFQENFGHFDKTKEMIGMRIKRLGTSITWAENPPSRTRHFVRRTSRCYSQGRWRLLKRSIYMDHINTWHIKPFNLFIN